MVEQFGMSVVPMFERQATAATYERLSGAPLDDLAWYELFAGVRFGVILVRMSHRSIAFGQMEPPDDPDEHVMFVPLLERLIAEVKETTS